jgi:hypothetical protein
MKGLILSGSNPKALNCNTASNAKIWEEQIKTIDFHSL